MQVVQFPKPDLNNIADMLRHLADGIESGEHDCTTLYVVMPQLDDYPKLFGFGNIDGQNDPIVQLELCKNKLLVNITKRI